MAARDWGLLLALSVVWGGSFFFAAVALTGYPPLTIVLARVAIAAATLVLLCRALGLGLPRGKEAWIACAGMGLLNNALPFTLFVLAQQHIPSGLAAVVNATTPVFAVLAAHLLTADEKLTRARLAGALTGLAGVAVLVGPTGGVSGAELLGLALGLAACLSYGLTGVWSRRVKRAGLPPLTAAAGQCLAATLMVLPLAVLLERPWLLPAPPAAATAALIGFGLVSTALAYWLFFTILASAGGTNVMLVTLLIPVTAILLGTLGLGETLASRHLTGMVVIGAGLLLMDGRALALLRAR